jgi:hypothetical protein
MFSNKGQNQNQQLQKQQQKGGYQITPSSSRHSTKRSKSRTPGKQHPLQNPAELQRVMSLFQ